MDFSTITICVFPFINNFMLSIRINKHVVSLFSVIVSSRFSREFYKLARTFVHYFLNPLYNFTGIADFL